MMTALLVVLLCGYVIVFCLFSILFSEKEPPAIDNKAIRDLCAELEEL